MQAKGEHMDDREQWRARIRRALDLLRGEEEEEAERPPPGDASRTEAGAPRRSR